MAIIFVLSFLVMLTPVSVSAVNSNVIDWVEEEQPSDKSNIEKKEEINELNTTKDKSVIVVIGQLIFYTLLIIVLIYGLIKFLALRQKSLQPHQAVKLMGGTPLGNNKSLQLVKVGEQFLLVGVGDHVTLIKEFSDPDEINSIENDLDKQPKLLTNSISSYLKEKISVRMKTKKNNGFEHLFNQSLDKQKVKQDQLKRDLSKEVDEKEGRL